MKTYPETPFIKPLLLCFEKQWVAVEWLRWHKVRTEKVYFCVELPKFKFSLVSVMRNVFSGHL